MAEQRPFARLDRVLAQVEPTARRFRDAGFRLYLVGGIVRDLWLGLDSHDLDFATGARPGTIRELLADGADALWTQGEKFGTIGARIGDADWEVTTFRREIYVPESRKPVVEFGDDLEVDLSRRDFTINAMAIDAVSGELIDPFGGQADLLAKRLVTPLDPIVSFSDDPLRVMRAARFADRFDLEFSTELEVAAAQLADRMAIVSRERVHDELQKLFSLDVIERGLGFLDRTGVLATVLPEATAQGIELAAAVSSAVAGVMPWWVRLAALLAPTSTQWGGTTELTAALGSLRCSTETIRAAKTTVSGAGLLGTMATSGAPISVPDLRRWVAATAPWEDEAFGLAAAAGVDTAAIGSVYHRAAAVEDLRDLSVPIDGARIMALTSLPPGPKIGEVIEALRAERIERGPLSVAEAERIVQDRFA